MFHFIPEITTKHLGAYAALDNFKQVLPKKISLTCDSWFGMKSWMEFNNHLPVTMSMSSNQGDGLWQLFSHNLQRNQFRTFSNNKILVTVFLDEGLLVTASTMFKILDERASVNTPLQARKTNVLAPSFKLSKTALELLCQFPKDDLVLLSTALGKSSSK
jgi:hypothetical protein